MTGVDYYELLGVNRTASAAEIKSAYRSLARTMHPDMGGTTGTFRLLREAYDTLRDPDRRATYDRAVDDDTDDEPAHYAPAERERTTAGRRAHIGDDPDFVPSSPDLTPADIPWWRTVDPNTRVRYVPRLGPERAPTLAMLGGWVLVLITGLAVGLTSTLLALWLAVVVSAGTVVLATLRRYLNARRVDRLFTAEFRSRTCFGRPESDGSAQRLTAELVQRYLARLPAVRIFHGLAWPGSVFADVDHAVLCGHRLLLIESKRWLPGHYAVDSAGFLRRNGHLFRGGATTLPEAVAAFQEALPGVEVRGVLVAYPSRAGEISTPELPDLVYTPEQLVREIGGWLALDPATVDRDVFRVVLNQVVSG